MLKKIIYGFLFALSFITLIVIVPTVRADDATTTPSVTPTPNPVNINFDVEGPTSTIFSQNILVPPCTTNINATSTVNGFCAFAAAGLFAEAGWTYGSAFVTSIGGIANDTVNNNYWLWFSNGAAGETGIDQYALKDGDTIVWTIERQPLKISVADTSPQVNATTTVTVLGFNANNFDFEPVSGASISGIATSTNSIGQTDILATSTAPFTFSVTASGFIPSQQFTITPQPPAHRVILSSNSVTAGQAFTAVAQQYNKTSATYTPLTNVTLGVVAQNPDSSVTEIATSTVDSNGQASFAINATGTLAVGIKEDGYFATMPVTITAATTTAPISGGEGGPSHTNFSIPNALKFISASQNSDGSFDSQVTSDWTAIAFAAENPGAAKNKLQTYLLNQEPALSSITDYERHAMALEVFGINPYSGASVNYISHIISAFDGSQMANSAGDNADIFALIVLEHAGYKSSDAIIQKEAAHILSTQFPNGSWDGTPDMTAAAIQALASLPDLPGVNAALGQAAGYLRSTEIPNGGWGNMDSTSWAQTAINAMIETNMPGFTGESAWTSSAGLYPTDYLAAGQEADGGANVPANRVWSAGYAVVAASGKSWVTILQSFPKPSAPAGNSGSSDNSGSVLGASTTIPSLKILTASTASEIATSTNQTVVPSPTPATNVFPLVLAAPPKTKIKFSRPRLKTKNSPLAPAVLGEARAVPEISSSSIQPTPAEGLSGSGFFTNIWRKIVSLLQHLF